LFHRAQHIAAIAADPPTRQPAHQITAAPAAATAASAAARGRHRTATASARIAAGAATLAPGRPASAASPTLLAGGKLNMAAGNRARATACADISAAATRAGRSIPAKAVARNATLRIRAMAPKLPIRLSCMIAQARSLSLPPPKPSAQSASPSSCNPPVSRMPAAIASNEAGPTGSATIASA